MSSVQYLYFFYIFIIFMFLPTNIFSRLLTIRLLLSGQQKQWYQKIFKVLPKNMGENHIFVIFRTMHLKFWGVIR